MITRCRAINYCKNFGNETFTVKGSFKHFLVSSRRVRWKGGMAWQKDAVSVRIGKHARFPPSWYQCTLVLLPWHMATSCGKKKAPNPDASPGFCQPSANRSNLFDGIQLVPPLAYPNEWGRGLCIKRGYLRKGQVHALLVNSIAHDYKG